MDNSYQSEKLQPANRPGLAWIRYVRNTLEIKRKNTSGTADKCDDVKKAPAIGGAL
jgi:hypothetical protein